MDQAASANQGIFWHLGERGQHPDQDRYRRLCARRYPQETAEIRGFALHNSTDTESDPVRENTNQSIGYKHKTQSRGIGNN